MKDRVDPEGLIFVHVKYWRAKAKVKLEAEDEADGLDGLVLKMKKVINQGFSQTDRDVLHSGLGYLSPYEVCFKEHIDLKPVQTPQLMHLRQPYFLS